MSNPERLGLRRPIMIEIEPRLRKWLDLKAGTSFMKREQLYLRTIATGLAILEQESPRDVIRAAEKGAKGEFRPHRIGVALDPAIAVRVQQLLPPDNKSSNAKKAVLAHAIRVAYLATHPNEASIESAPQLPEWQKIFRVKPVKPRKTFHRPTPPRQPKRRLDIPASVRNAPKKPAVEPNMKVLDGREIRAAREELGLSQYTFARAMKLSRSLIAAAEKNKRNGHQTLARITRGILWLQDQRPKFNTPEEFIAHIIEHPHRV